MDTSVIRGADAVVSFRAAREVGEGIWAKQSSWYGWVSKWAGEEWAHELLDQEQRDLEAGVEDGMVEYEPAGRVLTFWDGMECGHHLILSYRETPDVGRPLVAYLDPSVGLEWEDRSLASEALAVLLNEIRWNDARLAELGLDCCHDFRWGEEDGGFFVVNDPALVRNVARQCRGLTRWWQVASDVSDLTAPMVLAYLRTGIRPERPTTA